MPDKKLQLLNIFGYLHWLRLYMDFYNLDNNICFNHYNDSCIDNYNYNATFVSLYLYGYS